MTHSRGGAPGRRVVVSGMGAVCASGVGARKLWEAARDGQAQIRPLRTERPYDGRIKIAAQVPDFDPAADTAYAVAKSFCVSTTKYLLDEILASLPRLIR